MSTKAEQLNWAIDLLKAELARIPYKELLQALCASAKGLQPGDWDENDWWWSGFTCRPLNALGLYGKAISNYKSAMRGLDPQRAQRENERLARAGKLAPVTERDRRLFASIGCPIEKGLTHGSS